MRAGVFGIFVLCCLAAGGAADPLFQVGNVAEYDVLNVRRGPSTAFEVVEELPPAYPGLSKEVCVLVKPNTHDAAPAKMPEWCLIAEHHHRLGWVNAKFLVPQVVEPAPIKLRFVAGYRYSTDPCQIVREAEALVEFLDETADLVGCLTGMPDIVEMQHEMGARVIGEIGKYTLLSVPHG